MVFLPKLICFCRVSSLLGSVSTGLGGLAFAPAVRVIIEAGTLPREIQDCFCHSCSAFLRCLHV